MIPPGASLARQRAVLTLRTASIRAALREQHLDDLRQQLERLVPDIHNQYSCFDVSTDYLRLNVRSMHAFQISLALQARSGEGFAAGSPVTVVDIGDSAGTHIEYLQRLRPDLALRCISVNLDEAAVARIHAKGLEAVCARAEALSSLGIDADVFLLFATLEHISDPARLLHDLAVHSRALVLTVPYVRHSRVGLGHIRANRSTPVTPENTHLFELAPEDWRLLLAHAGWAVTYQQTYLQYPTRGPLRLMKRHWRETDFEGFWGAALRPDPTWASWYSGW